ncbi:MAG: chemotaxis protein CheW [Pseudomonadota bacterium]
MTEELYSLLVPLDGERLIVPRACVAEVVRYSKLEHEPGTDDYMLGNLMWNGRSLPVASFEGSMGKDIPAISGRTRIVIFVASSGALKSGYFGVLTQGFPQLVRVNSDVLRFESEEGWPEESPVYCRVKMINEFPLIPNLDRLESLLAASQD